MRLKINLSKNYKHEDAVHAIGWVNSDEIISAGDDHKLVKWTIGKPESFLLTTLKS